MNIILWVIAIAYAVALYIFFRYLPKQSTDGAVTPAGQGNMSPPSAVPPPASADKTMQNPVGALQQVASTVNQRVDTPAQLLPDIATPLEAKPTQSNVQALQQMMAALNATTEAGKQLGVVAKIQFEEADPSPRT